jgi:hypothetical protein
MHQHEMQQSIIYLGIYIIVFYFFWKIRVLQSLYASSCSKCAFWKIKS